MKYLPKLPEWLEITDYEQFKLFWSGCYYNNIIYLYGLGDKFENWVEILIHEELHKILFDVNLKAEHHEYIINEILNDLGFDEVVLA